MTRALFLSILFLCLGWVLANNSHSSYRINHQYFKAKNIAPQKNIEIHYFFSFQCAACGKLYPILEPFFHESMQNPIFFHPLAANQAGVQLIRAYHILNAYHQGPQYIRALYTAPIKAELSDKEIVQLLKKNGNPNFEYYWEEGLDETSLKERMRSDVLLAQKYKISALPIIYIIGPKGAYYLHPSPDLPPEKIPGCIEAVLCLQKEKGQNPS